MTDDECKTVCKMMILSCEMRLESAKSWRRSIEMAIEMVGGDPHHAKEAETFESQCVTFLDQLRANVADATPANFVRQFDGRIK